MFDDMGKINQKSPSPPGPNGKKLFSRTGRSSQAAMTNVAEAAMPLGSPCAAVKDSKAEMREKEQNRWDECHNNKYRAYSREFRPVKIKPNSSAIWVEDEKQPHPNPPRQRGGNFPPVDGGIKGGEDILTH